MSESKLEDDWSKNQTGLQQQMELLHCIGALDGKNIQIQSPAKSGFIFQLQNTLFSHVNGFGRCQLFHLC